MLAAKIPLGEDGELLLSVCGTLLGLDARNRLVFLMSTMLAHEHIHNSRVN
jgi:hypothetical protein